MKYGGAIVSFQGPKNAKKCQRLGENQKIKDHLALLYPTINKESAYRCFTIDFLPIRTEAKFIQNPTM